jgi:hypothetical protein
MFRQHKCSGTSGDVASCTMIGELWTIGKEVNMNCLSLFIFPVQEVGLRENMVEILSNEFRRQFFPQQNLWLLENEVESLLNEAKCHFIVQDLGLLKMMLKLIVLKHTSFFPIRELVLFRIKVEILSYESIRHFADT